MSKQTVVYDIETMDSVTRTGRAILRNVTEGIHYSAMHIFSAGRRTGKSTLTMNVLKNRYYTGATDRTFWADTNLCKEILLPMHPEPKYKFSRAKWYTAELAGYATWKMSDEYNRVIEWCTEQFGKHPAPPDAWSRWKIGIGCIYFRDEADYILYQLKWS